MQLYGYFRSGNTRKVRLCLAELGVDYELVTVDLATGEQRSPDYLRLNPNGVVPTLVDDELVLWESSAILLYLAEKYPQANLLPQALDERARVYNGWCGSRPPSTHRASVWWRNWPSPKRRRMQQAIATLRATIARNLEILAEALGGNDYLLGHYTLADLVMLPHLAALNDAGFPLPGTVRRYLERLAARPAWQATLAWQG